MTATLEDLDIAEVLAYRNTNTPLWDGLVDAYDADTVTTLGTGWPPVMALDFEQDTEDDENEPGDGEDTDDEPAVDSPDTEPAEAEPAAS